MFSIFKKKSPIDKLYKQYEKLMKEAHALSTVDRKASDLKHAEAAKVMKEIDLLKKHH